MTVECLVDSLASTMAACSVEMKGVITVALKVTMSVECWVEMKDA